MFLSLTILYHKSFGNKQSKHLEEQHSFSTVEAVANREDYDEDQGNQYSKNYQLDLHVLQPHFPPDLGPRITKVLCLQEK